LRGTVKRLRLDGDDKKEWLDRLWDALTPGVTPASWPGSPTNCRSACGSFCHTDADG
jgi:hypothetical protein